MQQRDNGSAVFPDNDRIDEKSGGIFEAATGRTGNGQIVVCSGTGFEMHFGRGREEL